MLYELLQKYKSQIIGEWVKQILDSYSSESSKFLNHEKNQFSNPVGSIISKNAKAIYDEIIGETDFDQVSLLLIDIIKIRAIQNFTPADAVQFIIQLKEIVKAKIKEEIGLDKVAVQFIRFETVIDKIVLIAFNLYMQAREKVFQIRMNEAKYDMNKITTPVGDV